MDRGENLDYIALQDSTNLPAIGQLKLNSNIVKSPGNRKNCSYGNNALSNTCRRMALRQRLSLNLNNDVGAQTQNQRRKTSRCRLFNINTMLRLANQQRRLSRFDSAWDLYSNPLSEDCVNPFSHSLNGKLISSQLPFFRVGNVEMFQLSKQCSFYRGPEVHLFFTRVEGGPVTLSQTAEVSCRAVKGTSGF